MAIRAEVLARPPLPWRQSLFQLAYRTGFTPWDSEAAPAELLALIAERPAARALDLGCGTGAAAAALAGAGWEVWAVDFIEAALEQARTSAPSRATFVQGDVTRLCELGLPGGFGLALDRGCFHSLAGKERPRYAAQVAGLCGPGATLLLFAFGAIPFGPAPFPPLLGVAAGEIEKTFAPWFSLESVEPRGGFLRPAWYRLRRLGEGP